MNGEQVCSYSRELFKILCKESNGFRERAKSLHLEKEDGAIFIAFLFFFWKKDKDFFTYMLYMREVGISLFLKNNGNFVIIPSPWSCWMNQQDYEEAREILGTRTSLVKEGLEELKKL